MDGVVLSARPPRNRGRHGAPPVFERLREQIISLVLVPGTVLSRAALQDELGVSSTPIRDALLRLQEEDLVEVFPQSATVVSPIDLDLARQAQFLRRSIEQEAVRTLAEKPDATLLKRLHAIVADQRRHAKTGDLQEFSEADERFHKAIYEAAGVPDLWALVRRHSGHIDRLRRLHLPVSGKANEIIRDHQSIVKAIESGDPDAAQKQLRDHLSRSLAYSAELRTQFPAYFRD